MHEFFWTRRIPWPGLAGWCHSEINRHNCILLSLSVQLAKVWHHLQGCTKESWRCHLCSLRWTLLKIQNLLLSVDNGKEKRKESCLQFLHESEDEGRDSRTPDSKDNDEIDHVSEISGHKSSECNMFNKCSQTQNLMGGWYIAMDQKNIRCSRSATHSTGKTSSCNILFQDLGSFCLLTRCLAVFFYLLWCLCPGNTLEGINVEGRCTNRGG